MINGLATDVNNNYVSLNDLALLNMNMSMNAGGINLNSVVTSNGYPFGGAPVQLSALGHLSPGTLMTSYSGALISDHADNANGTTTTTASTTSSTPTSSQQRQQQKLSIEYLAQLLKDKKSLTSFPNIFLHVERLIEDEISKVRTTLFHVETGSKEDLVLPEPQGNAVTVQERVYVPVKDYPDFNFVGRILGPRGMTAKQLEQETGCKIMVRGKGSMRDKKKEDANRGKPNWEHLNDELHVLVQCEDTENRAALKMKRALEEVKLLLVPAPEGEDDLKRKQLMELALINGTYRPSNQGKAGLPVQQMMCPMSMAQSLRSPSLGAPIYLSPQGRPTAAQAFSGAAGLTALQSFLPSPAGLDLNSAAAAGLLWQLDPFLSLSATGYPYTSNTGLTAQLLTGEYAASDSQAGAILNQRRMMSQVREHPYQRSSTN